MALDTRKWSKDVDGTWRMDLVDYTYGLSFDEILSFMPSLQALLQTPEIVHNQADHEYESSQNE